MRPAQARAPRADEGYVGDPAPRRLRAVEPSSPAAAHSPRPVVSASRPDPARRTVLIGEAPPAPRRARPARTRRRHSLAARPGAGPDRLAAWAVVLGLMMAVVAAASARGDDGDPSAAGERPAAPLAAPAERGSD